ncbi:MAG: hypothetical protein ACSLFP_08715 [Acidimicrobiales bacterium]
MSDDPRRWSPSERPDWEREASDHATRRQTAGLYRWYRWTLVAAFVVLVALLLAGGDPFR